MDALEADIFARIDAFFKRGTVYTPQQILNALKHLLEDCALDSPQLASAVWWELGLRLGVADDIVTYFSHRAHLRQRDIRALELPAHAENALRSQGIHTIDDLRALNTQDLMRIPRIGEKTVHRIHAYMEKTL
ncbi:DNA-directed RNA polymerase subunit alpha C-terminal domain-containing protein [Uliginosibacterium gangwonense]|uniref:DNA-directed RNA polymerase subunit alpha C-terminal domain-containing protein n=1 Tax=Uliginosibacterium gangwonense TaxID=392736 RepID=UPI00037DF98B|nr:DNA-directed RNA polymerase subunit alpha C-terminal domain-containing protein [Uliginosibacterium gangwonense]